MCDSVGILFFMFLVAGSSFACDTSSIVQCQQTFMNDLGISGGSSQDMSVLNSLQSAERIDLICTSFQPFKRCFERFVSSCAVDNQLARVVYYLNNMYDYICNTGRADMVRYSDCWNTGYVQNGANQCEGAYSLNQASSQDICNYLDNTLACTGDVVYNHCGVKSATAYTSIVSNSLLMAFSTDGSCNKVEQTFGTVGNNPYENGRVPSNASSHKPMNSAYLMCIAMIFLLSLKKINVF